MATVGLEVRAHGRGIVRRRPIEWIRAHPLAADGMLAVLLTVLALVVHATSPEFDSDDVPRAATWWTPIVVVAGTVPVTIRRVRPILALTLAVAGQLLAETLDIVGSTWLGVLVCVYSVGAHTEGPRCARAIVAIATPVLVLMIVGLYHGEITIVDAIASICTLTAAYVLGDNLRRRRQHVESLADRAERAEREREILARERVTEERARIARELHDIVAHSVSVMVIQATAARRSVATRPAAAEDLLANIERTGRQTMDELRQVLGVLRDADAGPSPSGGGNGVAGVVARPLPTVADLPALVDATAGLVVRLAVTGVVDAVPAGTGVSVYRVVQEAITNANRHAGPAATIDVRVACTAWGVDVQVDDDGRGASAPRSSDGYGLLGMHERVASAGGTFQAGPRPGGGWRVSARFPLAPPTIPLTSAAGTVAARVET